MFSKDDLIYNYSRADALGDGALIDVSELAREAGFKYPAAITSSVDALIMEASTNPKYCNDYDGILWDILWMCRSKASKKREVRFQVIITGLGRKKLHTFKAVCGPGDNMEPVVTIMLPEEN